MPPLYLLLILLLQITYAAEIHSNKSSDHVHSNTPNNDHHTPILEAEARTARELSHAVQSLQTDLSTCHSRVDAIQTGFQNLYAAHLANVDGLKKCKEGVLEEGELEDLIEGSTKADVVDRDLLVEVGAAGAAADSSLNNLDTASTSPSSSSNTDPLLDDKQHQELITTLEAQVNQLRLREKAWERTISELVARRDLLERREGAWERTIGELMAEVEVRAKRENWYEGMKEEMEMRIGMLSRIGVLERFGPGPHYVSIQVELDNDELPSSSSSNNQNHEIILQLAPLDLMPHSIHLFLSQITEGYWSKGTPAIVINAGHVLQACPHPCFESLTNSKTNNNNNQNNNNNNALEDPYIDMKNAGIDSVSFQEYSPLYPHEKYTIGFAGRPHSGPEFYFNLLNNTLDHGPVEQRKLELGEELKSEEEERVVVLEPDPCFGKVVEGFEVVDAIAGRATREGSGKESKEGNNYANDENGGIVDDALNNSLLVRPVKITSVTILEKYTPKKKDTVGNDGKDEL